MLALYPETEANLLFFLFFAFVIVLSVVFWCLVYSKAGFNWALGLLTVVPIAGLVVLVHLALGKWPIIKRLERLEKETAELRRRPATPLLSNQQPSRGLDKMRMLCSGCNKYLLVEEKAVGRKCKCPHCGTIIVVPGVA